MDPRYQSDFYSWAMAQSELAHARSSNGLDWDHVAEELRLLGVSEERELVSRLRVLIAHLLKWTYQHECVSKSWRINIANQREELLDHIKINPGLKSKLPVLWAKAFAFARRDAAIETDLDLNTFPLEPPFTYEQAIDEAWVPNADKPAQSR